MVSQVAGTNTQGIDEGCNHHNLLNVKLS